MFLNFLLCPSWHKEKNKPQIQKSPAEIFISLSHFHLLYKSCIFISLFFFHIFRICLRFCIFFFALYRCPVCTGGVGLYYLFFLWVFRNLSGYILFQAIVCITTALHKIIPKMAFPFWSFTNFAQNPVLVVAAVQNWYFIHHYSFSIILILSI